MILSRPASKPAGMAARHRVLHLTLGAAAASALPWAALAQTAQTSPPAAPQTITITGSNIKRLDAEGPSPVLTISREEIDRSAAATVGDLVRALTVNSAASYNESNVNNQSGASGVSLRGLGQKSTLVLINGRRFANHAIAQGTDTFVDINSIPKAAVERIEVLKEGASAIYGSDAIAGVVNFILKKNYQGGSAGVSVGRSTEGGLGERNATLSLGLGDLDAQKFNVLAILDYFHRDRLLVSERAIVGDGDFRSRPGGGLPWQSSSGGTWVLSPPVNGAARAPLNPCQGPSVQQPGSLFFTSGTVCGFSTTPYITYLPEADRLGLLSRGTLAITPGLTGFGELSFAHNVSKWINQPQQFTSATTVLNPVTGVPTLFNALIPAANPANPYGRPTSLRYTFFDVGPRDIQLTNNAYRALGGLAGSSASWDWEAAAGVSESRITEDTRNQVDAPALTAAINNNSYNFAAPTAAQTASIRTQTQRNAKSRLTFGDAKASTTVAGIGIAVGADARRETMEDVPDNLIVTGHLLGTGATRVSGSRTVVAGFGELSAPFGKQFELQAAVRADHYSDFGNAVTPKLAAKWTPLPQLLLRASFNRGFRAPTLAENAQSTSTGFVNVTDPTRNNASTLISGIQTGNPNLQPEKSGAASIGFVLEPVKGFSLALDYYDISQTNLVALNGFQYIVSNAALFPGAVVRDANGVIVSVADQFTNVSKVETSGVDLDARWRLDPLPAGRFTVRFNGSYVISFKQPAAAGQPLREWISTNNGPAGALPRTRVKLALDWDVASFTTTLAANQVGTYRQSSATALAGGAPADVSSMTTVDLTVAWNGIKNLKIFGSVQNLRNTQPPWDPTFPLGFSLSQYDMRGRYLRAGVEYRFW
jgi:iron complex outermembrane receptor protein